MATRLNRPRPWCLCGCPRRVRRHHNKYATQACVPTVLRSEGAKNGRRAFRLKRRAVLFRDIVERATRAAGGHRLSVTDLFDCIAEGYDRGYGNGYHAADWKHRHQKGQAA